MSSRRAYLFFWDKLEKSNYFLESILDTLDEPANGRLVVLPADGPRERRRPVGYALQPDREVRRGAQDRLCPSPTASSGSREMDTTLTEKLREYACILRKLHKEGKGLDELRARKTRMLGDDLPPALHLPGRASQDLYL